MACRLVRLPRAPLPLQLRHSSHSTALPPPKEKRERPASEIRSAMPPPVREALSAFPSVISFPVRWGDQDSFRHVNNLKYGAYAEHSRIAYLHQLLRPRLEAIEPRIWAEFIGATGISIIAANLGINFRRPVEYPETLHVGTRIPLESMKPDRFNMDFAVITDEGHLAADGHCGIVSYDYRIGKKCHTPDYVREAIEAAEAPFADKPLPTRRRH
ncbi:HotDog domain-containing protein [Hyaloraphidium curvatum]|nr:HotDog domain-containing protein [Hyaloraphidium curvatum]